MFWKKGSACTMMITVKNYVFLCVRLEVILFDILIFMCYILS